MYPQTKGDWGFCTKGGREVSFLGGLAKVRGWADSRNEERTQAGGYLEIDSVPPVQTGSPRCFGAFWRSLGQLGQGKVLVKEHGAVQGVLDWGGTGALCRAGGGMQVGMGRGREPLGWEEVLGAVGQQMAEEDWSWALPAQRSTWGHPTAPGTAHGSRAPTLGSVTVPDPRTI